MALTYAKALLIAERHIKEQIANAGFPSHYQFGEVGLQSENESFWTFLCGSSQLFDQGIVPGAIYACVDKEDGQVWSDDKVEKFYLQKAATHYAQPGSVAA